MPTKYALDIPPVGSANYAPRINDALAALELGQAYSARRHGIKADGGTDDTAKWNDFFDLVEDGSVIAFDIPGASVVNNFKIDPGRKRISVIGLHPKATYFQRRFDVPGNSPLGTIGDNSGGGVVTEDILFTDVGFDVNNVEKYGGLGFYKVKGLYMPRTKWWDSNLRATWETWDHYGPTVQLCEDVFISYIEADDVELLEADNNINLWLSHFVSRKAAGTTALGWFSVNDGSYAYDYHFQHGRIIDPRKNAVTFQHEVNGRNNNTVKRVNLTDIDVIHDTIAGLYSLNIGEFTGLGHNNNVWEDVTAENFRVFTNPALAKTSKEVFLNYLASGAQVPVFKRFDLDLKVVSPSSGADTEGAADLRYLKDSRVELDIEAGAHGAALGSVWEGTTVRNSKIRASSSCYRWQAGNSQGENQISSDCRAMGGAGLVVIGSGPASDILPGALT